MNFLQERVRQPLVPVKRLAESVFREENGVPGGQPAREKADDASCGATADEAAAGLAADPAADGMLLLAGAAAAAAGDAAAAEGFASCIRLRGPTVIKSL